MFIKQFILIVFLFSLLQTGCNETNTNSTTEQTPLYFPLDLGNSWTYMPEDSIYGVPIRWAVTEKYGDTNILMRPCCLTHTVTVKLRVNNNNIDIISKDSHSFPFYRFTEGMSWIHRNPWECDDSLTFVAVKEKDTIDTPAGSFTNCLRLERRTPTPCPDAETMFEWWAPGVGLVKWDELNYYAGGPISYYLKSYSVK
jgi:hypothetical protein